MVVNCLKWLEMAGMAKNGWTWLECMEMDENGWKLLGMARMAVTD